MESLYAEPSNYNWLEVERYFPFTLDISINPKLLLLSHIILTLLFDFQATTDSISGFGGFGGFVPRSPRISSPARDSGGKSSVSVH